MEFTEQQAAEVVEHFLERLKTSGAFDVLNGIEESRQLGIEESLPQTSIGMVPPISQADFREVGTIRRRPPTNEEMVQLVLNRLYQRLIVLPEIAHFLRAKLGNEIVWRVDPEFVSSARTQILQAGIGDLLPDGLSELVPAYRRLREMTGMPSGVTDG